MLHEFENDGFFNVCDRFDIQSNYTGRIGLPYLSRFESALMLLVEEIYDAKNNKIF